MPKENDTPIKKPKIASSLTTKPENSINDVILQLKSREEKYDNGTKIINSKLLFYEKNFVNLKSSLDS